MNKGYFEVYTDQGTIVQREEVELWSIHDNDGIVRNGLCFSIPPHRDGYNYQLVVSTKQLKEAMGE